MNGALWKKNMVYVDPFEFFLFRRLRDIHEINDYIMNEGSPVISRRAWLMYDRSTASAS